MVYFVERGGTNKIGEQLIKFDFTAYSGLIVGGENNLGPHIQQKNEIPHLI